MRLGVKCIAWVLLGLLSATATATAQIVFESEVERVVDGDTVVLAVGDILYRARLHGIDAPESRQPWGRESTELLRMLVGDGHVRVEVPDIDRYGRLIVRLYRDGLYINHELVVQGAAWRYTEYDPDGEFSEAERQARTARAGLWSEQAQAQSDGPPVAPWEWRRR